MLRPRPASLPTSPTALLRIATETLQKASPDFAFVPVLSHLAGASRSIMFLLGMSGSTTGEDVSNTEFSAALTSIRIAK